MRIQLRLEPKVLPARAAERLLPRMYGDMCRQLSAPLESGAAIDAAILIRRRVSFGMHPQRAARFERLSARRACERARV